MDAFSNEAIFYGGLIILCAAVVLGIVYAIIYCLGCRKLNAKFDAEYGKRK